MKQLRSFGCLASFVLLTSSACTQAQSGRAVTAPVSLFHPFPRHAMLNSRSLASLFKTSDTVSLSLTDAFQLRGAIISLTTPNPYATTVIIQLAGFPGAILTVSRIRNKDHSCYYIGHVLAPNAADALRLQQENGKYCFTHTAQRFLQTE